MSRIITLMLAVLILAAGSLAGAQDYTLLWQDDFNGPELDSGKWIATDDNSGGGNDELQYYTSRDTNVYIEDGMLVLRALEESYGGLDYTSGKVITKGLADWRYGRIEASIRLPAGRGIWPAFWMMPTESVYGGWPNSGEIDIVELIGSDTNTVYGTIHYGPPWNYTNGVYNLDEGTFADTSHLFAIEWNQDSIMWFVDDDMYSLKTADSLNRPEQWKAFRERFYIILNLAVGGNWPGSPDETTVFPQKMEIDYVRVYGDPALQEIIAIDSAYPLGDKVRYSFSDVPGASFEWSVPESATILSGQGTHLLEVKWGCDPGDVGLTLTLESGEIHEYILPVTFSDYAIYEHEKIYPLENITLTAPLLANTTYSWNYPDDAVAAGTADESISLTWGCAEEYVTITAENICGTYRDSLYIELLEPSIAGPATVSESSINVLYTVDSLPQTDYYWTVPGDAAVATGQGTDSVLVDFGFEGGSVAVELSNQCFTKTLELPIRITDTIILADYESTSPVFEIFSNTTFEMAENPDPDEVNSSQNVGKTLKSEVPWSGIYTDLGYNLDLSKHKEFQLKVYGPKKGNILLKLEDKDVGTTPFQEVLAAYQTPEAWQNLSFAFPNAPTDAYDRITLFFDFGSEDVNTFYFDDLTLMPSGDPNTVTAFEHSQFKIYPNPATEIIRFSGLQEKAIFISISDTQGRIISREQNRHHNGSLDITSLKEGLYILTVETEKKTYRTLFFKE